MTQRHGGGRLVGHVGRRSSSGDVSLFLMNTREPQRRALADGVPGESLFFHPFLVYFPQSDVPDLFKKAEGVSDDRLLAVVTALIVENRIEKCLRAFMPKFEKLSNSKFWLKVRLLEALNFVPQLVIEEADLLGGQFEQVRA